MPKMKPGTHKIYYLNNSISAARSLSLPEPAKKLDDPALLWWLNPDPKLHPPNEPDDADDPPEETDALDLEAEELALLLLAVLMGIFFFSSAAISELKVKTFLFCCCLCFNASKTLGWKCSPVSWLLLQGNVEYRFTMSLDLERERW